MTQQEVIDAVNSINNTEEQIETLESILNHLLDDGANTEIAESILMMMERCARCDDFGTFSTAETVIDKIDDIDVLLRASIRRRPMWKTLEMIGESDDDIAALEDALKLELDEETRGAVQSAYNERKQAN